MTLTNGELEPEFVSYATLRRHTFCFKGMKQCEFDHDPTDSRAPPVDTRALHCGPFDISSLIGACVWSFLRLWLLLAHSAAKMFRTVLLCYSPLGSLGVRHAFCICNKRYSCIMMLGCALVYQFRDD